MLRHHVLNLVLCPGVLWVVSEFSKTEQQRAPGVASRGEPPQAGVAVCAGQSEESRASR